VPKYDILQDRILAESDEAAFLAAFRNSLQRDTCTLVIYAGLRQNDLLGL